MGTRTIMETHGPILARRSRPNQQVLLTVLFVCLFVVSLCPPARADVGVILNESLKSGLSSKIVAAGHSAVYLSRVCPVSPVRLRLCEPGEQGSVISTYSNFDEDQRFQWNIVPLSVFYTASRTSENDLFCLATGQTPAGGAVSAELSVSLLLWPAMLHK